MQIMNIYIVNHPGGEPLYGRVKIGQAITIPWATKSHCKKFIEREGITISSCPGKETIHFWGEYEPKSEAEIISKTTVPKAIHKVLCPVGPGNCLPVKHPEKCFNTDPYVFGEEFYYFNCKRRKCNPYNPGDIILFGTVMGDYKFYMDTLIAIKELRPLSIFDAIKGNYWECTLNPALYKGGARPFDNVIVGSMYNDDQSIYSFVPCHKASNPIISPTKPVIDVVKYGFRPITNTAYYSSKATGNVSTFNSLVSDVVSQGFDIASYIDPIF